jgi:hypothetical protein
VAVCHNAREMTSDINDSDRPGHAGATADHGADDNAHDDTDPLGPIDAFAWGAGILGVGLGLAVALAFAFSTGML